MWYILLGTHFENKFQALANERIEGLLIAYLLRIHTLNSPSGIIFSGKGLDTDMSECDYFADHFIKKLAAVRGLYIQNDIDVPAFLENNAINLIHREPLAMDTAQNAVYSFYIILQKQLSHVIDIIENKSDSLEKSLSLEYCVCTSAFHIVRSKIIFQFLQTIIGKGLQKYGFHITSSTSELKAFPQSFEQILGDYTKHSYYIPPINFNDLFERLKTDADFALFKKDGDPYAAINPFLYIADKKYDGNFEPFITCKINLRTTKTDTILIDDFKVKNIYLSQPAERFYGAIDLARIDNSQNNLIAYTDFEYIDEGVIKEGLKLAIEKFKSETKAEDKIKSLYVDILTVGSVDVI